MVSNRHRPVEHRLAYWSYLLPRSSSDGLRRGNRFPRNYLSLNLSDDLFLLRRLQRIIVLSIDLGCVLLVCWLVFSPLWER